jgi:hypothetical protein
MGWMVLVLNASVSNSPHPVRYHFIPLNSFIRLLFCFEPTYGIYTSNFLL